MTRKGASVLLGVRRPICFRRYNWRDGRGVVQGEEETVAGPIGWNVHALSRPLVVCAGGGAFVDWIVVVGCFPLQLGHLFC